MVRRSTKGPEVGQRRRSTSCMPWRTNCDSRWCPAVLDCHCSRNFRQLAPGCYQCPSSIGNIDADIAILPAVITMTQPNRSVAGLVYDDLCKLEFSSAADIFGLPRPVFEPAWYRFLTVAAEPGPCRATLGFQYRQADGLVRLNDAAPL